MSLGLNCWLKLIRQVLYCAPPFTWVDQRKVPGESNTISGDLIYSGASGSDWIEVIVGKGTGVHKIFSFCGRVRRASSSRYAVEWSSNKPDEAERAVRIIRSDTPPIWERGGTFVFPLSCSRQHLVDHDVEQYDTWHVTRCCPTPDFKWNLLKISNPTEREKSVRISSPLLECYSQYHKPKECILHWTLLTVFWKSTKLHFSNYSISNVIRPLSY